MLITSSELVARSRDKRFDASGSQSEV